MIRLKRILAPTDFSEYSLAAMRYACEFASRFDAELHVLHAIASPLEAVDEGTASPYARAFAEYETEIRENAEKQLAAVDTAPLTNPDQVVRVLRGGFPFVEILQYAKAAEIDLIVIGTHGRSGLQHILLGSVAEKIVRKSPCPVLSVRHPEHDFVMP